MMVFKIQIPQIIGTKIFQNLSNTTLADDT